MKEIISPESMATVNAIQQAFDLVDHNEKRANQLDSGFEQTGQQENRGFYNVYEAAKNVLVETQTEAVEDLGKLVVSTNRTEIEAEINDSNELATVVKAPSQTQSHIRSLRDRKSTIVDLFGPLHGDEAKLLNSSEMVAANRLSARLEVESQAANEALEAVEGILTVIQRPLPESTIAGETADLIKQPLKTIHVDPSGKEEVVKAKSAEVQNRFIDIATISVGALMTSAEIGELLHPKDFKIDRAAVTKRVTTMLTRVFAGEAEPYIRALAKKGLKIQRFAHRKYVENGNKTELSQVSYEYYIYDKEKGPQTKESYTEMAERGIIEHSWEHPMKKGKRS